MSETTSQKKQARKKRERDMAEAETEAAWIKKVKQEYQADQVAEMHKEAAEKKDKREELGSDKMKLDTLAKKTEELQGYVNQLQDAVTIGMVQLRDLKRQVAAAAALASSKAS